MRCINEESPIFFEDFEDVDDKNIFVTDSGVCFLIDEIIEVLEQSGHSQLIEIIRNYVLTKIGLELMKIVFFLTL